MLRCGRRSRAVESRAKLDEKESGEDFDPATILDGRAKTLAEVARRQGQRTFRSKLLKAYAGQCAFVGTAVTDVLEAAHITPYRGKEFNHVQNGLLLRADIHTLFDLKLLKIEPRSMTIVVSPALQSTEYAKLHGQKVRLPAERDSRPSEPALKEHFGTEDGGFDQA